jgi:hypothetical protein
MPLVSEQKYDFLSQITPLSGEKTFPCDFALVTLLTPAMSATIAIVFIFIFKSLFIFFQVSADL